MKSKIRYVASATFLAMLSASTAVADDDLQAESKQATANFQKADSSLQTFFSSSAGYAVFPSVGKGGFIVKPILGERVRSYLRTCIKKAGVFGQPLCATRGRMVDTSSRGPSCRAEDGNNFFKSSGSGTLARGEARSVCRTRRRNCARSAAGRFASGV